ncbi:MAG: copper chaperone PCu(A)C [Enhydrobacter sp.]|nr:copper chaperone PCu(A)C [Enhydrobacter sp.]
MKSLHLIILSSAVARSGFPASAHDYAFGSLKIGIPWAGAVPPASPPGGSFLTVTNTGAAADRLVSATSSAAVQVEVHEMRMDGSISHLRGLDNGRAVLPDATVTLTPGGFHLMMIGIEEPLEEAAGVPVTLVFEKAGKIDVELQAMTLGASFDAYRH